VQVTWTKGSTRDGKPIDYDSSKDVQTYAAWATHAGDPLRAICPSYNGGNNFFPTRTAEGPKLIYIPAYTAARKVGVDHAKHSAESGFLAAAT